MIYRNDEPPEDPFFDEDLCATCGKPLPEGAAFGAVQWEGFCSEPCQAIGLARIALTNGKLIPDPDMQGHTDVFSINLQDFEELQKALEAAQKYFIRQRFPQ